MRGPCAVWPSGSDAVATVTAEVRRTGASSPEASISQQLMVEALPEIVIGPKGERIRTTTTRGTRQAVPKAGTPGIVPNIEFFDRTATSVRVRWGQPSDGGGTGLTGFGLKFWKEGTREPGYEPEDVDLVGPPPTPSEYTKTGMERGARYNFRIHACNGEDSCGYWTHPPKKVGVPLMPHTISVEEKKGTSARVKWSPEADTGGVALTGFAIRWRVKDTSWPTQPQAPNVPPGDRRYTMSPLSANTTYEVSLQSCNAPDSCSPWTGAHEFTSTDTTNEPGESPPGPVRMLRITGVRNGTLDVAWQAPSDSGSTALTGYKLQYKQKSSTWGSSTNVVVTDPRHTISGRTNGTKYDVRVQACNANISDPCGDWVSPVCGVPGTTTQAGQAVLGSGGVTATGTGGLRVSWDPPSCVSAITHYEVPHKEKTAVSWPATGKEVITGTATTLLRLTVGTPYQVRVRACNSARTTTDKCGAWSATQDGTPSGAALPAPENLDLKPLPRRWASVTWNRVTNADAYDVEVQIVGETTWLDADCIIVPETKSSPRVTSPSVTQPTDVALRPKCEIDLDKITTDGGTKGLADNDAYRFRVRATASGFAPSLYSENVIIIDTPITSANGHSPDPGANAGKAAITWASLDTLHTDALFSGGTYKLRYRRTSGKYSDSDWNPGIFDDGTDRAVRGEETASAPTSHTFTRLTRSDVYAIQLLYEKDGLKVFAARDIYVWPSEQPFGTEGIATFPINGYPLTTTSDDSRSMEFKYYICADTFPSSSPESDWVPFINHAMLQWEYATDELVKMIHEGNSCVDYRPFLTALISEVRGIVDSGLIAGESPAEINATIARDGEALIKRFHDSGVNSLVIDDEFKTKDAKKSAIMMIRDGDWSDEDHVVYAFSKFGGKIGLGGCSGGCAQASKVGSTTSTDIYLRESYHVTDGQGILRSVIQTGAPKQIHFNKCPGTTVLYHKPYSSIVHEAGHAIGLGHPDEDQVKAAIMSYYTDLPQCAPHPLDVMSIYALYQSKVSR